MDDLPIQGDGNGLGGIDDPLDVAPGDLPALDGDHTVAVEALDMSPGNPGVDRGDFAAGHQFRLFHRFLNGIDRALDVDHYAFAQAHRGVGPHADDIDTPGGNFSRPRRRF